MNVALLFDGASAFSAPPDTLILDTVGAIEQSLVTEGNKVTRIPVHPDGRWMEKVRRGKFDLAFNMCEGIDGVASLEPAVIAVLELFAVPYTGCTSYTATVCLRRNLINTLLDRAGLPVPAFGVARRGSPLPPVGFPAICKPAAEDASVGIEQRSVVRTTRALAARVAALLDNWYDLLFQPYLNLHHS